jgi:hypothetical protein
VTTAAQRRLQKRETLLGMKFSTARTRLERMLLFAMAAELGRNKCFRCGETIESVGQFSIEHTKEWQYAENPRETFFGLADIAFSHRDCNANAAQKRIFPHGNAKNRDCPCEPCLQSRRAYNAQWMANWRAKGADKSRNNFVCE